MVKLLALLARRHRTALAELVGATTIVVSLAQWNTVAAGTAAGVAVLAKSMEWGLVDSEAKEPDQ